MGVIIAGCLPKLPRPIIHLFVVGIFPFMYKKNAKIHYNEKAAESNEIHFFIGKLKRKINPWVINTIYIY